MPPGRGRQIRGSREVKFPLLAGCQMLFNVGPPPPLGSKMYWSYSVDEVSEIHKSEETACHIAG